MEKQLLDFIKEVENGQIEADDDLRKLIEYVKKTKGKCPQCGNFEIIIGFLRYEKYLTCKYCEQNRRFGSKKITIEDVRHKQLNDFALGAF